MHAVRGCMAACKLYDMIGEGSSTGTQPVCKMGSQRDPIAKDVVSLDDMIGEGSSTQELSLQKGISSKGSDS